MIPPLSMQSSINCSWTQLYATSQDALASQKALPLVSKHLLSDKVFDVIILIPDPDQTDFNLGVHLVVPRNLMDLEGSKGIWAVSQ